MKTKPTFRPLTAFQMMQVLKTIFWAALHPMNIMPGLKCSILYSTVKDYRSVICDDRVHFFVHTLALQPLVPYIMRYVARQVHCHMKDTNIIYKSLLLLGNLVKNLHLELERYGHQLLPCMLSCLLANNLGGPASEDSWKLRDLAAVVIKLSVGALGNALNDLHGRVTRQLCNCLENAHHPLETQYGELLVFALESC